MQQRASWRWSYRGLHGEHHAYVRAVDPRDALSRALTTQLPSGALIGERLGIPVDVLAGAPGNADTSYSVHEEDFVMRVEKVVEAA